MAWIAQVPFQKIMTMLSHLHTRFSQPFVKQFPGFSEVPARRTNIPKKFINVFLMSFVIVHNTSNASLRNPSDDVSHYIKLL